MGEGKLRLRSACCCSWASCGTHPTAKAMSQAKDPTRVNVSPRTRQAQLAAFVGMIPGPTGHTQASQWALGPSQMPGQLDRSHGAEVQA